MKDPLENDFYSIYNQDEDASYYSDESFAASDDAIFWADSGESNTSAGFYSQYLNWERI